MSETTELELKPAILSSSLFSGNTSPRVIFRYDSCNQLQIRVSPTSNVLGEDRVDGNSSQRTNSPYMSIPVANSECAWYRKLWSFTGLGLMVAVGYVDPGNWSTDLEGGSSFGYTLLSVIFISNIFAILLQYLALKVGIARDQDLAQTIRASYPQYFVRILWIMMEIAIAATDLAEVVGSAIALNLLFGISLVLGCVLTTADVLLILILQQKHFKVLELIVATIVFLIFSCFLYQLIISSPHWESVGYSLIPQSSIVSDSAQLFVAIGILGATVMPHNLFLHSSIILTRAYPRNESGKSLALKYAGLDSAISLMFAFFINSAILILAATAFAETENAGVKDLSQAYHLLSPSLGQSAASIVFAVALLASGQNSTISGTLAGQIIMEGFVDVKMKPWARRLLTRSLVVIPAVIVTAVAGEHAVNNLLIMSQVIISITLSFATFPLLHLTSSKSHINEKFVNGWTILIFTTLVCLLIAGFNIYLVASPETYQWS